MAYCFELAFELAFGDWEVAQLEFLLYTYTDGDYV